MISTARWMSALSACAVGLVVVSVASPASAAGEPCLRDTDCTGAALCVQQACSDDPSLTACEGDDGCEGGEACDEGFCKQEGVVCENPAGTCWVENGSGICACASGEGAGWSDGFNPDDPPEELSDEELAAKCVGDLEESCGTEAPSVPDDCVGEPLQACETYVAKVEQLAALCGEEPPQGLLPLIECCETQGEPAFDEQRACILAIEADSCPHEAIDACEGGGEGTPDGGEAAGDGDNGEDPGQDGTNEDEDAEGGSKTACAVGAGAPSGWALVLVALAGLCRRRR